MTNKDNDQLTYFSFVEPWGYEDTIEYFTKCKEKIIKNYKYSQEIYFHRELLGYSKEKRYLELITITGRSNCFNVREDIPYSKDINIFP